MGRFLRQILETVSKGFYLDSQSTWYDQNGAQIFGLRHVNFVQNFVGINFLHGLDRLIVYNCVAELRNFCRTYGFLIGGGNISEERRAKARK
jgi:hypothetical protein